MRPAQSSDTAAIERLYRAAFPPKEADEVAALAVALLTEASTPETLSLVSEREGRLSGHIGFSPVGLQGETPFFGFTLAPLAVDPAVQGRGIGSRLVEAGLQRLRSMGAAIVFVYGDPAYYGRFGFEAASATAYVVPYTLQYPFGWQALRFPGHEGLPASGTLTFVSSLQKPELW